MEFEFYTNWDIKGSVRAGREIMKKIIAIDILKEAEPLKEIFPQGHNDADNEIDRYSLNEIRWDLAYELSGVLTGEVYKLKEKDLSSEENNEVNNPQVLIELLSYVSNESITHFTLG